MSHPCPFGEPLQVEKGSGGPILVLLGARKGEPRDRPTASGEWQFYKQNLVTENQLPNREGLGGPILVLLGGRSKM